MKEDEEEQEILPITSDFFFEVFPFNIVFRQVKALSCTSKLKGELMNVNERKVLGMSDPLGHGGAQCWFRIVYSLP